MLKFFLKYFPVKKSPKKVFVFGDSHARVFNFINKNFESKYDFDVTAIGGATAQGLANPRSKTNALNLFRKKIEEKCQKDDILFFFLGEVDCGFVIWYRAKKYKEPVEIQFNKSIDNYKRFLSDLKNIGFKKIYIIETVPPTIFDGNEGEISHERKEVNVSIEKRTELTKIYNKRLEEIAKENQFGFVSLSHDVIDENSGLVKSLLLNNDKTDHHLRDLSFAPIMYKNVLDVLD